MTSLDFKLTYCLHFFKSVITQKFNKKFLTNQFSFYFHSILLLLVITKTDVYNLLIKSQVSIQFQINNRSWSFEIENGESYHATSVLKARVRDTASFLLSADAHILNFL